MKIFKHDKTMSVLYQRALSLSISKEFADKKKGKMFAVAKQDSEQEERRRELLAIEQEAEKEKTLKEHGFNHFREQALLSLHEKISQELGTKFTDKMALYSSTLKVEDTAPDIMELLSLRAASIYRISPLVKALPWLADELINLVNKPQYRKRAEVQVTDANLALSYIGLDNLKLLVPTFMLKHWLPQSTSPFPIMKRKLWNNALSIALVAKTLANSQKLDPFTAFTAGMLSNIGLLIVTQSFLEIYAKVLKSTLNTAYIDKDKKLYAVLIDLKPNPELLLEFLISHSSALAADMIELMRFERLGITNSVFELADQADINDMTPIARIVVQATAFVACRNLTKEDLINTEDAEFWLNSVKLTPAEIKLLKKTDIDHIKLNFK